MKKTNKSKSRNTRKTRCNTFRSVWFNEDMTLRQMGLKVRSKPVKATSRHMTATQAMAAVEAAIRLTGRPFGRTSKIKWLDHNSYMEWSKTCEVHIGGQEMVYYFEIKAECDNSHSDDSLHQWKLIMTCIPIVPHIRDRKLAKSIRKFTKQWDVSIISHGPNVISPDTGLVMDDATLGDDSGGKVTIWATIDSMTAAMGMVSSKNPMTIVRKIRRFLDVEDTLYRTFGVSVDELEDAPILRPAIITKIGGDEGTEDNQCLPAEYSNTGEYDAADYQNSGGEPIQLSQEQATAMVQSTIAALQQTGDTRCPNIIIKYDADCDCPDALELIDEDDLFGVSHLGSRLSGLDHKQYALTMINCLDSWQWSLSAKLPKPVVVDSEEIQAAMKALAISQNMQLHYYLLDGSRSIVAVTVQGGDIRKMTTETLKSTLDRLNIARFDVISPRPRDD